MQILEPFKRGADSFASLMIGWVPPRVPPHVPSVESCLVSLRKLERWQELFNEAVHVCHCSRSMTLVCRLICNSYYPFVHIRAADIIHLYHE